MIRDVHIEFIKGFIEKLNNNVWIYIEGKINNYVRIYLNKNNVKLLINKNIINDYDVAITFTYNFNELLEKLKYKGNIISYAHGISLKPYFPNKIAKKNQLFLCAFAEFQKRFFKENGINRVELFPYLKLLTIDNVFELEEISNRIDLKECVLWAPTLINNFSNSSVKKVDNKIFELSKSKNIFILLHPQTEIGDIKYYLRNKNIYLINRCYYSNKIFENENCINIKDLTTSIDILNYFNYIICDQSTIFYEGLFLNKKVYRTDLKIFNKIKLDELEKYDTTICPYSLNKMDNKYNKDEINIENILEELIKKNKVPENKIKKPNNNKIILINYKSFNRR